MNGMSIAESIDYSEPIAADPVEEALAANFRGLPLSYSNSARAAAARYGLAMIHLSEDDLFTTDEDGEQTLKAYPGMTDDAAIITFTSLCAANAGRHELCPKSMKSVLRRKTLAETRDRIAMALMDFFDAFEINVVEDTEIYETGFGLMNDEAMSRVEPVKAAGPGKLEAGGQP